MRRGIIISLMLTVAHIAWGQSPLDGLCGEELFKAVRAAYGKDIDLDIKDVWHNIAVIDNNGDGKVTDIFSGREITIQNNGISPEGCGLFHVLPYTYWKPEIYPLNLCAIFPTDINTLELVHDYPPAFNFSKISPDYQTDIWGTGVYTLAPGFDINCYYPPKGHEGDFARIVMMMITLYPCESWQGKGNNICLDNSFPVFQNYYIKDLIEIAAIDPVDQRETERNNLIARVQGQGNPFVEYPQLASHIWGSEKETPFQSQPESIDRVPVKATYTASDKYFFCYSPYLPGNVESFEFNGQKYDGETAVPLDDISVGKYLVRFKGKGFSGTVIIEIVR